MVEKLRAFIRGRRNWFGAAILAFLVVGGLAALVSSLHLLSRYLIAIGLVLFSVAAVLESSVYQKRRKGLGPVTIAIAALALIAAIDEVLPDPYRSSTVLLIVAALVGLLMLIIVGLQRARR